MLAIHPIKRVDHKWVDGQQRWSVAASPTLREDVEAALLKRDAAHPDAIQRGRHDEIVFSDNIPVFEFLGLPNLRVVTEVSKIRKFAIKHHLSVDQIVDIPNGYDNPVAIMRDEDGYVLLTDRQVTTDDGEQKPMRLFLRPTKWRSGEIVLLATAMAENGRDELEYYEPRIKAGLMFADENRIAGLNLGEETESILRIQASGENVKTAADFSAWKSTQESIAKSAAGDKGPRLSIGARRRAEFRELMGRKRPDIAAEDVEAYLDEIAGYDNAKKQKLAVHWIITGAIELPEDAYKLDKAIATAERAKVDPFRYRNPEDIFAAFPQHLPKEKPIDPDTVPELTGKRDMGHGVTVYDVSEKIVKGKRRAGQVAMRKVINTHWGKDASPWCLLQGDGNGELTEESRGYWEHYSALPKKVAFLNGRLLAFMATDDTRGNEIHERDWQSFFEPFTREYGDSDFPGSPYDWMKAIHPEELEKYEANVKGKIPEQWWDRKDASHDGIPIEGKIAGDPLGRSGLQELKDGKLELVGRMWKGDRKNGKYEEWNLVGNKVLEEEFKNGRPFGWRRAYSDHVPGKLKSVEHFNEKGEHDRPQVTFNEDKGITYIEYTDGDRPLRSLRVGGNGDIVTYQMNGGEGSLAKIAIHTPSDGTNISWTDDAGNYYSTFQDRSGNIDFAYEIRKGEYGRRSVDLSDAALRAKLEGESAAVLEAVKAEAAAIYREYSPAAATRGESVQPRASDGAAQDGTRWSIARRLNEEREAVEAKGGELLLAHHGTDSRGFTRFEKSDDIGYFFAKSRRTAASYIRHGQRGDENKPGMPDYSDVMTFLEDEASGYTPEEVEAMSYEEKVRAYVEGTGEESGVYDVALKMEDPYRIDCHGANWDAIYDVSSDPEATTYDLVAVEYDGIEGQYRLRTREFGEEDESVKTFEDFDGLAQVFEELFGEELGTDLQEFEAEVDRGEKATVTNEIVDGRPEKGATGAVFSYRAMDGEGWWTEAKKTRDIVEDAANMGCDGVIFYNVVDNGGGIREADADDVYVVMKSEQVKSVDSMTYADDGSIIPAEKRFDWKNPDIRWSVGVLPSGENVVILDRTEEIAKINLNDPKSLHDYLVGKVGKELFDNFVVGSDAPDEYVYSKDAQGNNKRVRKAKAKLATSLDEAAAVASDASTEPAAHKEREGGVYYRRRFLFAAPSGFGGDYRAYSADMISYMEDGVEQFYDVVNIEDAPSVSADLTQLSARIAANGTSRIPADGGATPRSISNPAAADNPLAAIANAKTTREVEAAARMSFSARLADGDERAAENALVNYVAYHKLTGGAIPRATTLARLGLALGMKTVQANRIIEDAQRVADRAAGTVIEKAARNGDVGTAFSLMEREKERDEELRKIISGGAKAGGDLVLGGVVAQGTLLGRRIEQTMRGMTAATLADMEGDTGLDLAAEILQNDPKAFDEELKPLKPQRGEGPAPDDTSSGEETQPSSQPLTDREKWQRAEAAKEAAKRVQAFIEAAKQRAEENRRKAEERRAREAAARAAGEEPSEGGESGGDASETKPSTLNSQPSTPTVAGFKNKWEFAAFVRKWAEDKYAQTHGTTTLGKSEENRLFAEFYRICVQKQLQDLADKLLDPKGARAWANRRIGELEKGLKPDTIERASADIFAFINRNAIREERVKLIEKFRKDIRQFIQGAEFEELKADSTRRLTGWVEEAARYMMKVCQLSGWAANGGTSQFERERQELLDVINARRKIYDESGKPVEDAEKSDAETVWARWKLNLLEQFGAMAQMMPGEIEDLRQDAIRYLTEEAAALEERWKDAKAWQDGKRRALAGAIVGPNGQKYDSKAGYFGQLFDALNGMLRLRLKHLMRFAGKKERAEGEAAADEIVTMLGQGETAYARAVQRDRAELWKALGRIFQTPDGRLNRKAAVAYMKRMEEEIPQELSRQLSFQGYAERMTYGQMLQLLVSLEQRSYAANVKANGREGQAELIRSSAAFTTADALFVDWLRAFYEAKRGEISAVTERMVGNKVESPDPLYCPVKIYRGEMAKDLHIDAGRWNAIDDVLSRRVMHTRDFDESATVLGQFYDRSNRMAGLVAWAERGTLIENVICSGAVQQQIGLAFGQHESSVIRRQLEDTFNGGQSRSKTPGEIVMMDKAMNFVTFGYLGFNPLSAVKQTTSFTVWANVLPGGFRELWHHMTHVDREAIRHIMESEEYKVRYGDDTGSGQDFATKALNENAGLNPLMRLMTGPGMWLLKKGDFLPGVWIMQGVYKSLLNKHLNEGMEETAADRLAITEAFNLLEETQQSGRTYNTNALAREHGRLGAALVQFATSPLQQLQYETQAFREWRDLKRYGADPERIAEARAKLIRAAFINHVLLPAALELVVTVFRAIMGDEPRWEKDGYAWDLLRDVLLGQASRIFYVGVLASSVMDALFKRQLPRGSQLIPSEGAITIMANVAVTAHDVMSMDGEKVRKDLERMVKSLAPTRIPYNLYRRVTGDSDVDRKRAKGK